MAFFSHNLIHTVYYARQAASPDANGDAAFGTQADAPAKVVGKVQRVTTPEGEERTSMHTVYTEAEVRVGDRVWVPALGDDEDDVSHARRPISVSRSPALRGNATLYAIHL